MINSGVSLKKRRLAKVSVLSDGDSPHTAIEYRLDHHKIVLDKVTNDWYKKAVESDSGFFERVGAFLTASNRAGRYARTIKDFLLIFVPYGKQVNSVLELITAQIERAMPEEKEKSRSRTIITFGILFVTGLLMSLNVIPPDAVPLDPDAEWVMTAVSAIGIIFRLITGKPVKLGPMLSKVLGKLRDSNES